ncbi:MAG: hypothetical protein ACRDJW_09185 [Thermomicrobiales bacterium]
MIDLGWRQKEFQIETSFDYAVMSLDESRLLGCVYVNPTAKTGDDAEISLRVRADELATGLELALETTVRHWIAADWPFTTVGYPAVTCPGTPGTRCQRARRDVDDDGSTT